MAEETIGERLEVLARAATAAAVRFDSTEPLRGGWAVLPSAFNPPTRAHLRLLELAGTVGGVGRGAALLTTRNVAKGLEGAPLADRIGMLLAAREARPAMAVLAANQARIVDQALALRTAWPEAAFDFVVGYDTLVRLFDERYYDGEMDAVLGPFFERHRVIAANRGAVTAATVAGWVAERGAPYGDRLVVLALDEAHGRISSSVARSDAAALQISADLPPAVVSYIRAHGLYRGERGAPR